MPTMETSAATGWKAVRFLIGRHEYAVGIERIREIIFYQPPLPVPGADSFWEGMIDLRGRVVPLIDLRARLGIPVGARASAAHILISDLGDLDAGLIVDAVRDVVEVEPGAVRAHAVAPETVHPRLFRGVCRVHDDLLLQLDLDRLLSAEQRAALAEVL